MKYIKLAVVFLSLSFFVSPTQAQTHAPWPRADLAFIVEDFLNDWSQDACVRTTTTRTYNCMTSQEAECFISLLKSQSPDGQNFPLPASGGNTNTFYARQIDFDADQVITESDYNVLRSFIGCYLPGDRNLDGRVSFGELEYNFQRYGSSSSNSGFYWSIGDTNASGRVEPGEMMAMFNNVNEVNGDVNLDGCVNFADYQILSVNYGKTSGGYWKIGDLNRDTVINSADYNIMMGNYGVCRNNDTRVFRKGDFDYNGCVDEGDYNLWRALYGMQVPNKGAGPDGTYDGLVDSADYIIWRQSIGSGDCKRQK
jgi:hypothetical protein